MDQSSSLLPLSLLENITLNDIENSKQEQIHDSLIKANINDVLKAQIFNDNDVILHNSLSGGQIQKINIARAYYEDRSIIILDEFTSSIDSESSETVLKHLRNNRTNKIIIFTTHKLQETKYADLVINLEE